MPASDKKISMTSHISSHFNSGKTMLGHQKTFGATVIWTALAFGVPTGIVLSFIHGPIKGIGLGAASGLLFGICMGVFVKRQFQTLSEKWTTIQGQPVIKRAMANHRINDESRGGQLLMTEDWLAFRAHENNFNSTPIDIPYKGISRIETDKTMGLISNRLLVTIINDMTIDFVLWENREWAEIIQNKISQ